MLRRSGLIAAGVGLLAVFVFLPRRGDACITAPEPTALVGFPADGDADVPTNVRPVFDGLRADLSDPPLQSARFEIVSASGEVIAAEAKPTHFWHFELFPAAELKPLTAYTVRGSWTGGDRQMVTSAISFTTGAARLETPPALPTASIRHYYWPAGSKVLCGPPPSASCVSVAGDTWTQANLIDEFGQEQTRYASDGTPLTGGYLYRGSFFTNVSGLDQGTNFVCVRLRSRAADGRLSEPVDLCRQDGALYQLAGAAPIACTEAGLTHQGRLVTASETMSGCSLGGPGAPNAIGLGVLAALAVGRRLTSRRRARP